MNKELQGKAIVKFVDGRKYPELTRNFPLRVVPTQVLLIKKVSLIHLQPGKNCSLISTL